MYCPLCKKNEYNEWGKVGKYSILICRECGLGITAPFPTENELTESNQEIYQVEQRIHAYLSRKSYFEKRYRNNITIIKRFKREGKLLDVGCNIGLFLNVAREESYSVMGVELNKGCAQYGINNFKLDIRADYLENIALASESIDIVTLFDVLEHIPDIHRFLSEIRRILKRGGLLVIQSPNIQSYMARLTRSQWFWLTPPDHLYHFTPATLDILLKEHGFDIKLLNTWEPAQDFSDNLLLAYISSSFIRKVLLGMNQRIHLFAFPVLIIQKLWWHMQRGGLIELYALKTGENHHP
jgi:SAM-dependent methyltransferase